MNKEKLLNKAELIKQQLSNPANINNHIERKTKLDELNKIKSDLKLIEHNIRSGLNTYISNTPEEFTGHIDNYRYFSLYNKLNEKYIKCNCKINIGDTVKSTCGKIGYVSSIIVYPELVNREISGIYLHINMIKNDGTKSQKAIRKSKLDNKGFPLEEIKLFK